MPESQIDLRSLQILLADDHAFIRNLIKGMLIQAGIANVHAADSGKEALDLLQRYGRGIDCIISDWNMPPPGGLELLRSIRTGTLREIPANLPFIMLTGHASSTVVSAALQLDVSAYIVKPASAAKLQDALQKSLTKSLAAKSPAHYRAVAEIDLPADEDDPSTDPATWAQWVKRGQPSILSNNSEFIERKPVALTEAPPPNPNQLHNVRYRRVDRIKPGSVVAEDFCDSTGRALVSAGTVLNPKILQKLNAMQDSQGGKVRIWVGTRER